MLLASVSLTAFTAPVNGAPDQETASSSVTFTHRIAEDGPSARFGFSVLDQAGTTVVKAQTTGTAGQVTQGVPVTFTVSIGNFQNPLVVGSNLVADIVWPNFTVLSAVGTGAVAPPAAPGANNCTFTQGSNPITGGTPVPPAGSTAVICTVTNAGQTSGTIAVTVVPNIGGPIGLQTADQACALNGTTATLCEAPFQVTVSANPQIATFTPTPTATVTSSPTVTNTATRTNTPTAFPTLTPQPVSGTPGVPCGTGGATCTATTSAGQCTFNTSSNSFSCTLTAPAGSGAGSIQLLIPTLNNPQGENQSAACAPSLGAGTSILCSGTLSSAPVSGGTVVEAFPNATPGGAPIVVTGTTTTSTAPGTVNTTLAITAAQGTAGFLAGSTGVPCATTGSAIQGGLIGGGIGNGIGGGFNPIGPIGGIGFNPLGPIGGFNGGINGLGIAGAGLGAQAGGQCQVTGTVTGTFTNSGIGAGQTFSLTTAVPAGTGAGSVPVVVISTTTGVVAFPCTAIAIGTTTATCTGTITGQALQGSTVGICFPNATVTAYTCSLGTVLGPGPVILNNPLPLLPPPPLQFIPPPPPPLLPPPPPAPIGGALTAASPMASVPVIPEADSIFLVVGGLVAVGALAGLRSLRRRRDDEG